ncbi:MAG TPA: cysteine protease StiP domain-containing protein, partial [Pseudomonas sp.]|uniref:cysteine protease StiP domain-containing protein n=1 Tax=Pseudomonas sp. TaxID=306 RepID=UPI002B498452
MLDTTLTALTVGSGSYLQGDVHFLLRPVNIGLTDVLEKERLIQTNQKHYSEMISREDAPSTTHMELYERAMRQNGLRMAADVQSLALALDEHYQGASIA